MKTSRIQRIILSVVATALLLGFTIPSGAGQTVPVLCDAIGVSSIILHGASIDPIEPGSQANVSIPWAYYAPAQAFSLSKVKIEFSTYGGVEWMQASISPEVVFISVPLGEDTEERGELRLTILLSEDAPPGEKSALRVWAEAEEGTCVTGADGESPDIVVDVADDQPPESGEGGTDESPDPVEAAAIPSIPVAFVTSAAMVLLIFGRRRRA